MSNRFGNIFSLTSFGESHGPALGGVIDGCPAGIRLDFNRISKQLARRRPGQSAVTTARKESDAVRFLSGVDSQGVTTGSPIGFTVSNEDVRAADYESVSEVFRPNHADYTYHVKYGGYNERRGGGRSSARETVSRVVAGAVALQVLEKICPGIAITAFTKQIGPVSVEKPYTELNLLEIDDNSVRCPDLSTARKMEELICKVKAEKDSVGGVICCIINGCPVGVGQPVFDKLSSRLAGSMMSINAAKGFEIGDGFEMASRRGTEVMDNWTSTPDDKRGVRARTNHSGGIQGGISNGEDIVFNVAFKPVATIAREIDTVDLDLKDVKLKASGRHDPCVVPRAVPIVEAMASMVLLDQILIDRAYRL